MLWSTVEQTRADRKLKTIINAERAAASLDARAAGVSPWYGSLPAGRARCRLNRRLHLGRRTRWRSRAGAAGGSHGRGQRPRGDEKDYGGSDRQPPAPGEAQRRLAPRGWLRPPRGRLG